MPHIGSTVNGTQTTSELCMVTEATPGPEIVHRIVLSQPGTYVATTNVPQTDYDSIVYVRSVCTDSATTLPCNDAVSGQDSVTIETATSEQIYYVIVETHEAQAGNYELPVDRQ